MSQLDIADNKVAADTNSASPAYVPPLQRTEGQAPQFADCMIWHAQAPRATIALGHGDLP